MQLRWLLAGTFLLSASANPLVERQFFAAPTAVIRNGTVIGSTDYFAQVDSFKGIPFAEQPVGTKRLTNPTPVLTSFGTFTATGTPTACPGYSASSPVPTGVNAQIQAVLNQNPLAQAATGPTGENCLNLNVQRPAGATATAKLPVLVYIYGGAFAVGSTGMYDGTSIIQYSVQLGKPVIYVAMSYRLNGFGFLPGKQMAGVSNLGLKDQRLALQWVQDNIASFGGDPTRVTIWGESAGAISVFDHTIINSGNNLYNNRPLFTAAIMNSGSIVPALSISSGPAQNTYDTVANASGCAASRDSLNCLRGLSYTDFYNAIKTVPGIFDYRGVSLNYLPRPDPSDSFFSTSPEVAVAQGRISRTPVIIGDQEDEGTLFVQVLSNLSTTDDVVTYFHNYAFYTATHSEVTQLVQSYPDDPSFGSPFRTGSMWNIYPEYKRVAAIFGDQTFTLARRIYLASLEKLSVPSWSYINSYLHQVGGPLGTLHGSDVVNDRSLTFNQVARDVQLAAYVSMCYHAEPNRIASDSGMRVTWKAWSNSGRDLLNFTETGVSYGKDDFREAQYRVISALGSRLQR